MKRRSSYIDPGNKTELAPDAMKGGKKLFFGENQNPFFNRSSSAPNPSIQKKSNSPSHQGEAPVVTEEKPQSKSGAVAANADMGNKSAPKAVPAPAAKLIVEDNVIPGEGQMRKSDFLTRLNLEVCTTVDRGLTGSGHSSDNCPYIRAAFGKHANSSADFIEQLIHRYEPESVAAISAEGLIRLMQIRVFAATKAWVKSGVLPEGIQGMLMSGIGGAASAVGQMTGVLSKAGEGSSANSQVPTGAVNGMGRGVPLNSGTKSQMETAFGTDFSDVELHADGKANDISSGMQARAFTYGNHISFASGEFQPGTLTGDALLAHELAHVVQQRNGKSQGNSLDNEALEEDADSTAIEAITSIKNGRKNSLKDIRENAIPRLKSGISVQRCGGKSNSEKHDLQAKVSYVVYQPDKNEAEIMKIIDDMGSDASDLLMKTSPFSPKATDTSLRELAGTEAGVRIIKRVREIFEDGDSSSRVRGREIDKILAEMAKPSEDAKRKDVQEALDKINKAIDADSRKADHYLKVVPPLKFPVTTYKAGAETFGGVYYDRLMPTDQGDAGITIGSGKTFPGMPTQYPLIYIKLGPISISHSENHTRSVLWHEFQHYQQDLKFRDDDKNKSDDTKALEAENADTSLKEKPNSEVNAITNQLADDFTKLSDDEVGSILRYLSRFLSVSNASFKSAGIGRIKTSLSGNAADQKRLLNLLGSSKQLTSAQMKNLKELTDAIKADLKPTPKPEPKPKPPKKKTK